MPQISWKNEDLSDRITFEYSEDVSERIDVNVENGVPVVYANRTGLVFLAKVFAKMASDQHSEGFHVHLGKNLDPDEGEMLRIVRTE